MFKKSSVNSKTDGSSMAKNKKSGTTGKEESKSQKSVEENVTHANNFETEFAEFDSFEDHKIQDKVEDIFDQNDSISI